jgi:hypothetical protein
LNLDTSHFSGKRRWSEGDLVSAVDQASSWADVTRFLGISDTSEGRLRLRGCAVRLGLDLTRLERARGVASLVPQPATPQAKAAFLRIAAESIAIAWFAV